MNKLYIEREIESDGGYAPIFYTALKSQMDDTAIQNVFSLFDIFISSWGSDMLWWMESGNSEELFECLEMVGVEVVFVDSLKEVKIEVEAAFVPDKSG